MRTTVADASPEPVMTHRSAAWEAAQAQAQGHYEIHRSKHGRQLTLSSDFRTEAGPDLKVALSRVGAPDATDGNAFRGALELGPLAAPRGRSAYAIPENAALEEYRSVIVYCEAFSKLWFAAPLDPR
ncbi:MAG: DM13 domain-containing protein [Planctomycetota bacterium]